MTVSTELCYAERAWTGVETTFAPGFAALDVAHVVVEYRTAAGAVSTLTLGTHYGATRDGSNIVTVTPIALPAAPGTLLISRATPATQSVAFEDLGDFPPETYNGLFDAAAMRAAEARRDIARAVRVPEGDTPPGFLPARAIRIGGIFGFDAFGDPTVFAPGALGVGVIGPGGAVDGQLALFNGDGAHLKAGGTPGTMALQNASAVALTGGTIAGAVTGATQSPGDNTTKLATTAFVTAGLTAYRATLGATLAYSGATLQTTAGTGDVTWSANSYVTTISAGAVTLAKMANTSASGFLGSNAGAGPVTLLTPSQAATLLGIGGVAGGVVGVARNLVITATSDTNVSLTADMLTVDDGTNVTLLRAVNLPTIASGSVGANGIDAGTPPVASGLYVWVIYNGTTVAGLLSLSATAPTMPGGYTAKALYGWIPTDVAGATNHFMRVVQKGKRAQFVVTAATDTAALPKIASGVQGTFSTTAPTWATPSLTGLCAPNAAAIDLVVTGNYKGGANSDCAIAPSANYKGLAETNGNVPSFAVASAASGYVSRFEMALEATTIACVSNAAGFAVLCAGWTLP